MHAVWQYIFNNKKQTNRYWLNNRDLRDTDPLSFICYKYIQQTSISKPNFPADFLTQLKLSKPHFHPQNETFV